MIAIRKTVLLLSCVLLMAFFAGCAEIGFRDEAFDHLEGGREALSDFMKCIDRGACLKLFELYSSMEHTVY